MHKSILDNGGLKYMTRWSLESNNSSVYECLHQGYTSLNKYDLLVLKISVNPIIELLYMLYEWTDLHSDIRHLKQNFYYGCGVV